MIILGKWNPSGVTVKLVLFVSVLCPFTHGEDYSDPDNSEPTNNQYDPAEDDYDRRVVSLGPVNSDNILKNPTYHDDLVFEDNSDIIGGRNSIPGVNIFNKELTKGKNLRKQAIQYYYKLKESNKYEILNRDGRDFGRIFTPGAPLKVLIHGFTSNSKKSINTHISHSRFPELAMEYMKMDEPMNVVIVDWTELSSYHQLLYLIAADCAKYAGEDVAEFILMVKYLGLVSFDQVHIIGFSLGAHVAGTAGHDVARWTGAKIGRITGLDPAGPGFAQDALFKVKWSRVLDKADAKYVDIIHCNEGSVWMKKRGSTLMAGHADFYPNGGTKQPECGYWPTETCSHHTCPLYYARSVNIYKYFACQCPSWAKFLVGYCRCWAQDWMEMGEHLDPYTVRGTFFLEI